MKKRRSAQNVGGRNWSNSLQPSRLKLQERVKGENRDVVENIHFTTLMGYGRNVSCHARPD